MYARILKRTALALILVAALLMAGSWIVRSGHGPSPRSVAQPQNPQDAVLSALAVPVARAASVTFDLCASDGTITLPDATVVPVWGFVDTGGGPCTTGLVTSLPGPEMRVIAGDTVTINLTNALAVPTSILVPGTPGVTSLGGTPGDFTAEAAPSGGTVSYAFTAQTGTYLYESGTDVSTQLAMGLYGALVVESGISGQAYGAGTSYDTEAVLVLSELDTNLNANPGGFNLLDYHPTYWLINGLAYPDTSHIPASAGDRVLLRYLNAGNQNLSMAILGGRQMIIAKNGYQSPTTVSAVAETIPAGQTADMIVDTSDAGPAGASLALYNRNLYMTNQAAFPGGMLTFIDVQAPINNPPVASIVAPTDGSIVAGSVLLQVAATDVEDDVTFGPGSLNVEWSLDGGANWTPAVFNGTSGFYEANWDTTTMGDVPATLLARATDSDGNRDTDSVFLLIDNIDEPPTAVIVAPTGGSTLTGTVTIQVAASDDRDAAGTLTVTVAIDGGTMQPAPFNATSGNYEFAWVTPAGDDGVAHSITAQATDSAPNTTNAGPVNVTVDNVNNSPTASFTFTCALLTCDFDASGSSDSDGTVVGYDWDFGDGNLDSGATVSHTFAAANTFNVQLTVTDDEGATGTQIQPVTLTVIPLHVGDLDGSAINRGTVWIARAIIRVHNAAESAVGNAAVTVQLDWTDLGGNPGQTVLVCNTFGNGRCVVSMRFRNSQVTDPVTFTVLDVTQTDPDVVYDPASNHDPDGDSSIAGDGTISIVVNHP